MLRRTVKALVMAASLGLTTAAAEVALVRDGRPLATVVLPPAASPTLQEAAATLVRCIEEATGGAGRRSPSGRCQR